MKIILVRHGHPDYVNDCLTELGHEQARLAAHRLKNEGISEIYSSSCGRAFETALHTANVLKLPITKLDFMREIKWGSADGKEVYKEGHPWDTSSFAVTQGYSLMDETWTKNAPFANNIVFSEIEHICIESDKWLEQLGYKREGANYRVTGTDTDKTIALFSHGGSSSALLSHLLNLPFFYLCGTLCPDFTAITAIHFSDEAGVLTAPMIELANDARHINGSVVSYEM